MNRPGRVGTIVALVAMLGGLMLLAACAGNHMTRRADNEIDGQSLDDWMGTTLFPICGSNLVNIRDSSDNPCCWSACMTTMSSPILMR